MTGADMTVWTIGHSNRTAADFLSLLERNAIGLLADIRRLPGSRTCPQFNQDALSKYLDENSIKYLWLEELGGRRRSVSRDGNTIWRNRSFRAYANYMETDAFRRGIEKLLAEARAERTAIMCSEAVWWRCHRALVADYLKANGVTVEHIMDRRNVVHPYTSGARIVDNRLSYEAE